MNAGSGSYQQHLLLALRLHNIPGPRIAEALAEVDSHVAETGEDPYQAFGEPKVYAKRLSEVLGGESVTWRLLLRSITWRDGLVFAGTLLGGILLFRGLFGVAVDGFLSLSTVAAVAGLIMLGAMVGWLVRRTRREADPVLDPRTGNNMAPPFPWWTVVLWACFPAALLLLVHLTGVADR